jgi:hypothetical protein
MATIEKALIAQRTIDNAQANGQKLAKEVLEDFMNLFAGMAAYYQPTTPEAPRQNNNANPETFEKWAIHAVDAARMLAPYQSPTFRSVMVAPAPNANAGRRQTKFTLTIFQDSGHAEQARVVEAVPVES